MKKLFSLALVAIVGLTATFSLVEARSYRTKSSDVYVQGHMKKSGKYVAPHYRSGPDKTKSNNYSTVDSKKKYIKAKTTKKKTK